MKEKQKKIFKRIVVAGLLISVFFELKAQTSLPHLIIVSLDGFRWDYLDKNNSPLLYKISLQGVHSRQMEPCYPSKTFPNHISILTGMYPENHGVISNHFTNPFTEQKYSIKDSNSVRDSRWYLGEFFWETAERQGIKTASYFWPGSEMGVAHRRPSYYVPYQHNLSADTILNTLSNWLNLPDSLRPRFITLYFHEVDDAGHKFGPDSKEVKEAVRKVDSVCNKIFELIQKNALKENINLVFVSDHGMTTIDSSRIAYMPDTLLKIKARMQWSYENLLIEPQSPSDIKNVYALLKQNEKHFKTYLKSNIPNRFHFNKHPFISNIIVIPDNGWVIGSHSENFNPTKIEGGTHGYDNIHPDMQAIFIGYGPAFKHKTTLSKIYNIDIYPMLCKIFNVQGRTNIDGRLHRINYILKQP